jgi:hypothetical protein
MKLEYLRTPWQEADVPHRVPVLFEDEHMVRCPSPSRACGMRQGDFTQAAEGPTSASDAQLTANPTRWLARD